MTKRQRRSKSRVARRLERVLRRLERLGQARTLLARLRILQRVEPALLLAADEVREEIARLAGEVLS